MTNGYGGWPVTGQIPRGRDGTVLVTIEDETGDLRGIIWTGLFAKHLRDLGSQVVEFAGRQGDNVSSPALLKTRIPAVDRRTLWQITRMHVLLA